MENQPTPSHGFIPVFHKRFLLPRYWGTWCAIAALSLVSLLSPQIRDPLLGTLGRWVGHFAKSARHRARTNLHLCFPELDESQRELLIDRMFTSAPQSIGFMTALALRGPSHLAPRIQWHGREIINAAKKHKQSVILMVPHGWAVDIPAMLLAAEGNQVAGMFHHQRNPVIDYFWNRARLRFGGRLHAREKGIKPFIQSVREGYWGYYLPDQDHGPEHSEFVDFFATYKATLPAIGRLMKICRATVIPLFPLYNGTTHQLDIYVRPPMDDLSRAEDATIARKMNEEVEAFIRPHPEHYTWILKLLKTRKNGEGDPYAK